MKFKTEQEFCKHVTEILLGLSITSGRKLIAIPEVPWGAFSNEQFDMLLLDIKRQDYLPIEFKLNGLDSLKRQVRRIKGVGIINTDTKEAGKNVKCGCDFISLYGYTGLDRQIETIAEDLLHYKYAHYKWFSIYTGAGMTYWWAFKNNESDLNGGITGGNRMSFAVMYVRAIKNLHKQYGELDFMLTHSVLRSGYSISTSRKYYRQAIAH